MLKIARRLKPSLVAAGVVVLITAAPATHGAEIAPHRALYSMTLESARTDSGVIDANGTMDYE